MAICDLSEENRCKKEWKTIDNCVGCDPVGQSKCAGDKIVQTFTCKSCVTDKDENSSCQSENEDRKVAECGPEQTNVVEVCSLTGAKCTIHKLS